MMLEKFKQRCDVVSKVSAVLLAPAIVLSTAATVVLLPTTVFLSICAGNFREKLNFIIRNPVAWVLLAFYAMFLVGVIYSAAPCSDILLMLKKYSKFLLAIVLLSLFKEEKWRDRAICLFMIGIFVLLMASYSRSLGWLQYGAKEVYEVFKHSIEFNFLMAMGAYVSLIRIFAGDRYRVVWIMLFVLIVHTILFRSVGRSGYFVFAALMGWFFVQKFKWRGFFMAFLGVSLLFGSAFIFSDTFKVRMLKIFKEVETYNKNSTTSVGLRITFIRNGFKMIANDPVIGAGTGSYVAGYDKINQGLSKNTANPHNEYIHIGVQFGFLGLLLLLIFFGVPFWYSRYLPERERYISQGIVISIMLGSVGNSWLLDVTEGNAYAYFIVLAFGALSVVRKQQKLVKH